MRILKVMPFFDPATRYGGVVSQARRLCTELARRGHEVFVITTELGVPAELPRGRWLERDGYAVWYARTWPWHRWAPYHTPTIRDPLLARLPSTDVLVTNVGLTLTTRLAARHARRSGVPHVYNAEGALCPTRLRLRRWSKRAFVALVERPLLRRAAAIQAVTEQEREDAIALGADPARVHVIPNGIQVPAPRVATPAAPSRWGIPDDAPFVLFLGRLHEIKGLDVLVDVFAASGNESAHLVLAGPDEDGSGRRALRRAAEHGLGDRVHALGLVEGDSRDALLASAAVFALTSRTEGLPNALLEALAAGRPCLATEACHVPEIETAGAGFVRPLDVAQLAAALRTQLGDAELRARQGAAARALAEERFALAAVATRLEALYADVAARARGTRTRT